MQPPYPPQIPPPGAPQPPPGGFAPPPAGSYAQPAPVARPTSTEAIIALVLGVLTMSSGCFPLGFAALYFGNTARKKALAEGDTGTNATLALIGMILGGLFGGLWLLFWIFEIVMLALGAGLAIFGGP